MLDEMEGRWCALQKENMANDKLEIIPLGGVGVFGMNMMAMRCGGHTIIIDAGMGFPEEDAPGVDMSSPTSILSNSIVMRSLQSSSHTGTRTTSAPFHS